MFENSGLKQKPTSRNQKKLHEIKKENFRFITFFPNLQSKAKAKALSIIRREKKITQVLKFYQIYHRILYHASWYTDLSLEELTESN